MPFLQSYGTRAAGDAVKVAWRRSPWHTKKKNANWNEGEFMKIKRVVIQTKTLVSNTVNTVDSTHQCSRPLVRSICKERSLAIFLF